MTVVIGRCHGGLVDPQWFVNYEHLDKPHKPDGSPDYFPACTYRMPTHMARNSIVKAMMGKERAPVECSTASHLFFIDDDTLLPPDALTRLLAHDVPIVSGFYTIRHAPFWPIPSRKVPGGTYVHITKYCKGLQEVDLVGAGCLLIKREVFEAMEEPYFWYYSDHFKGDTTEDTYFCEKAQKLGFPVLLDFDVQCRHLTTVPVGWPNWLQAGVDMDETSDTEEVRALSRLVIPWKKGAAAKPAKVSRRKKAS